MITNQLPTEPGIYLFCGFRDGKHDVRDVTLVRGVEVVRVFVNAGGKTTYVGMDFFYRPHEAVGSWTRISDLAEAVVAHGKATMLDHVTRSQVAGAFESPWGGRHESTRAAVVRHLVGPFNDDGVREEAEKAFDRAVELGLIVPSELADHWRLAEGSTG
jgi:hypothetical protein